MPRVGRGFDVDPASAAAAKMPRDGRGFDVDPASAAAAVKMPRDGRGFNADSTSAAVASLTLRKQATSRSSIPQGLEAEAAQAVERAWDAWEDIASFSLSPERLNPPVQVTLHGNVPSEGQSLSGWQLSSVDARVEDGLNALQKELEELQGQSGLTSETNRRKRSYSAATMDIQPTSSPTPISPNRRKKSNSAAIMDIQPASSPTPVSPNRRKRSNSAAIMDIQPTSSPTPVSPNWRKRSNSAATMDIQPTSSPTPVSLVQKRCKRINSAKSLVWKHFNTGFKDKNPIATCNYCGQVYACDRSTHGTSTLWKHLRYLCPKDPLKGQTTQRKNQGTPKQPFNIEDCRKALADMLIIDEMPFTTVEGVGFKKYSKVLQPRFEPPSRVTVARDCWQRYIEEKPKLKKVLRNQRICLTTDTWTSKQNLNYMCLTAHWIDDEWKLQKRIINYCSVSDYRGETLGKRVEECLLKWGVDRLFTVTVDNASSNDKLIGYLKGVCKNWNGVVLKNKFLHVRCSAHIVNLVVKSGLEEHNDSIEKIRKAVRFVRSSPSRLKLFMKCAELEKIPSKSHLTLDLETRWNSTYLMLEDAEKFEKAFARLEKDYKPFKAHFGKVWENITGLCCT